MKIVSSGCFQYFYILDPINNFAFCCLLHTYKQQVLCIDTLKSWQKIMYATGTSAFSFQKKEEKNSEGFVGKALSNIL